MDNPAHPLCRTVVDPCSWRSLVAELAAGAVRTEEPELRRFVQLGFIDPIRLPAVCKCAAYAGAFRAGEDVHVKVGVAVDRHERIIAGVLAGELDREMDWERRATLAAREKES